MFEAHRTALRTTSTSFTYSVFLRHAEPVLDMPRGVALVLADGRFCGCGSDACFFCVAVDDAVYALAWQSEEDEVHERYLERYDPEYRW